MSRLLLLAVMAVMAASVNGRSVLRHQRALRQAGGDNVAPSATALGTDLSLYNVSGVWVGVGDQYDAAVWAAYFEEGALPACGSGGNFTYKHWGTDVPDSVALAANGTAPGIGINGHETGTYVWSDVTYDGKYIKFRPDWAPEEVTCARFAPYVDQRNGFVYASVVYKTEWRKTDSGVNTTDLSCSVDADEAAGCYPKGKDVVHSVSVTTYRCAAGACAGYAPAALEKEESE